MSSLNEIIQKRRSVRNYKETPVDREIISSVIDAGRLSPSACNAQPWRFIAVTEKNLIKQIVTEGLGGVVPNKWAASAPVIIVGCAQLNVMTHRIGEIVRVLRSRRQPVQGTGKLVIRSVLRGRGG